MICYYYLLSCAFIFIFGFLCCLTRDDLDLVFADFFWHFTIHIIPSLCKVVLPVALLKMALGFWIFDVIFLILIWTWV